MASTEERVFEKGEWITHPYHGVGQITQIEQKTLNESEQLYYRVETENKTFWIPLEDAEDSTARPVVTEKTLEESLDILADEPEVMADNYRTRRSRINDVRDSGRLVGIARLLRDLAGRRRRKSLNSTERRAYREFRQSLIAEWSRVEGITKDKAESRFRKLLGLGREKAKDDQPPALDPLGKK